MIKQTNLFLILTIFNMVQIKAQQTILWKIQDTTHHKISYLLGTAHQIGASFIESFPAVEQAMLNCSVAIFESIEDSVNNQVMRAQIYNRQPHQEIQKVLSAKDYKTLEAFVAKKKWNPGLLNRLEPQELVIKLHKAVASEICNTYTPSDSLIQLDDYLELKSKKLNLKVVGLETPAMQLAFIRQQAEKPSWESQKRDLKALLHIMKKGKLNHSVCDILTNYKNLNILYQFEKPCAKDVLVAERNANWLKLLPDYLQKDNCFIAVGLYHLRSDCGLIMQLKQKGFLVTPVLLK